MEFVQYVDLEYKNALLELENPITQLNFIF
jgi:hypothetical protein